MSQYRGPHTRASLLSTTTAPDMVAIDPTMQTTYETSSTMKSDQGLVTSITRV